MKGFPLQALLILGDGDVTVGLGDKALQHLARAQFLGLGHAIGHHVGNDVAPANGSGELLQQVGLDFGGIGVGLSVHILVDGATGSREVGSLDSLGQLGTSGLHQGRVEGTTHLEGQRTASAGLLEFLTSSLDGGNLTRDDHLTGAVIVSGNTDAIDGGTDFLHLLVGQVMQYPGAPLIVLTGGEPSLWINDEFVTELKQMTGKRIAIETNGTHPLPDGIDWVTLSPKSGIGDSGDFPVVLTCCDELKVVYLGQDLAQYEGITATHRYLQPCWVDDVDQCRRNMQATVKAVLDNPQWRLSLQTHRILGIQ